MKTSMIKKNSIAGSLNVVSDSDIGKIHNASLSLLEDLGVMSESKIILDLFKKHGAKVDMGSGVIKIAPEMVTKALKTKPSAFVLHGLDPAMDCELKQGYSYYGMGGSSVPFYFDYDSKRPRPSRKDDCIAYTKVGSRADHIDIILALGMAGDVPDALSYVHEYDAVFRSTTKPVIYSAPTRWFALKFIEMAIAAAGGEEEFRRRPFIGYYTSTISPMKVGDYNDGIIDAVKMGVPIVCSAGAMMGSTCPVTLAGTLVQMNAEALFGIVFTQLIQPGAPVIYGVHGSPMDMGIGQISYSNPIQPVYRGVVAQLGRYYDIPTYGLGGGVESKIPDAEAGAQAMMGLLFNALIGLTITITSGTMGTGLYGSAEMLLICDELIRMVKKITSGVIINDERLAVDVIKEVGHGGEFLTHDHTMKFFRDELDFPKLFTRQEADEWIAKGAKTIEQVANERVRDIVKGVGPAYISPDIDTALQETLARAVQEQSLQEK